MKIVADENIPLLETFFRDFLGENGELYTCHGRNMTPEDVADADMLLVRSITQVNEKLLAGSQVRFVATATSGTDHVDKKWLKNNNIGFSSAAGCNADAVVDYVLAALDNMTDEHGIQLQERTVGIVGYGQVGSRLYDRLKALGVTCLVCDPFKEVPGGGITMDDLVNWSDIISFHTPLTDSGPHPTFHILDQDRLQRLRPGTILVNAGRGGVVDNNALKQRLQEQNDIIAVLDVWEGEPELDPELLDLVAIGTPHIAGYSVDGKVRGTAMIYQAACKYFGQPETIRFHEVVPAPSLRSLTMSEGVSPQIAATMALKAVYDIRRDDRCLRQAVRKHPDAIAREFDLLRRNYPKRREFSTLEVIMIDTHPAANDPVAGLGFRITE
ncbi:4-phosphoerythronate dehydrogenase PdxB [Sansalvadorimonas sp. 2012CJ34-2]|uniref:Erythronate-4-phosphate dehydrogenase n=1 Tax=Parendozoicomonas callyspongiae TaxID=2942213 RepID=A0ABT0PI38_9GAMM|nr:4-phosphoerythronate dehydrogenase PdxB [Sansalvadorimonas sp. 2012CJ34-2]MCL6271029.1 4-phosphoerythronate dehydrogenase PdxB [Sansalvadorimonas sp. 2012CJ34-2]